MLLQLCLALVAIYVTIFWLRTRKFNKIAKHFSNSLKTLPFLGHVPHFLGDSQVRMEGIKKFGRIAIANNGLTSIWLAHKFMLVVAEAETADVIMKNCLDRDEIRSLLRPLIGNGLMFAPVEIWRPRRKVIVPTFKQRTLNNFVRIFVKQSSTMVDILKLRLGKGKFSIFEHVTTYTMDSVCETTLGVEVNSQQSPNHPVLKAFTAICEVVAGRISRPWLWSNTIHKLMPGYSVHMENIKVIKDFVDKIIKSKREAIAKEQNKKADAHTTQGEESRLKSFLELLIDGSGGDNGFTDVELREETLVMILAGTDTSAVGASFTSLLLAKYPDVQEKVYQEIREVLKESEQLTADDLPKLKYLEAVIKESLRMFPPVPIVDRQINKKITLPCGVTLESDAAIMLHIWALHRNPKYWGPDVNVFKPERFFNSVPTHPAAYVPFGHGLRTCIGFKYALMSMKTVLATLIRNYRLLPALTSEVDTNCVQNTSNSKEMDLITTKYDIMMKDVDNFELQLELRT